MRINSLVEAGALEREIVQLSPEESHHLARVLRVQPGQPVTLFDGCGGVAEGTVAAVAKTAVEVRIAKKWFVPPPAVEIELIQAVPKPDRWELVLQKAVELGATAIRPMRSERTEYKPVLKRAERWEKIVLNAAQQCEVRWLPLLHPVAEFDAVLPLLPEYDRVLVGSLYDGARPFRDIPLAGCKRVALLIGPEGDFTPDEVAAAVRAGAVPVSFGDRILRTETAAIFGLSVLAYQLR